MSESQKTVLFVSHDSSATGAPIFLLRFLRWLRANRQMSFRILVGSAGPLTADFEKLAPVDLFTPEPNLFHKALRRLNLPRPGLAAHRDFLRRTLAAQDIGLIYANTVATAEILDYLSFLDCPVICHVHELEQAIKQNLPAGIGPIKRRASAYIAVSDAVKRNLISGHSVPEKSINVIHGFIPTSLDRERTDAGNVVRQELGIPADAKIVVACGSIERRKGTDLFLQVALKTRARLGSGKVHFLWVGGSSDSLKATRKEVQELSCEAEVHFVGHRPDVSLYYEASDVFLLTSREDPFPLVMMEAALRGKPIVCFGNSGGAPEFVEEDAGIVVKGFDVEEMAEKLVLLLESDSFRASMGQAGREKVLSRHDINFGAPRIAEAIEAMMQPSRTRQAVLTT